MDDTLEQVVEQAWRAPFTVKSDLARKFAEHVAMAASLGLITTRITKGVYGCVWHITPKGLAWIGVDEGDE